jgi:hypothetical protein
MSAFARPAEKADLEVADGALVIGTERAVRV